MRLRELAMLCLAALSARAQQEQRVEISGTVRSALDGSPIRKSRVQVATELSRSERDPFDGRIWTVLTDDAGRFRMYLDVRTFYLAASAPGFLRTVWGQRRPGGSAARIQLRENDRRTFDLTLWPQGAIQGRIEQEDGTPAAGAVVSLLQRSYRDGQLTWRTHGEKRADEDGAYRFAGLSPGRYLVRAAPGRMSKGGLIDLGPQPEVTSSLQYANVFYPGTTELRLADPIEIRPGSQKQAVDFRLQLEKTVALRGRVTMPPGQQLQELVAVLSDRSGAAPPRVLSLLPGLEGAFEVKNVSRGSYLLGLAGEKDSAGFTFVEVGDQDVTDLRVVLQPPAAVKGTVRFEPPVDPLPEGMEVRLDSRFFGDLDLSEARPVKEGGRFELSMIATPSTRFSIDRLPPSHYVKSAQCGGLELLENEFDPAACSEIDIRIAAGTGSASGMVTDSEGRPAAGALVLLIPENGLRRDLIRDVRADSEGRWRLDGIPPGDYRVSAWEDLEPGSWFDPEFPRRNSGAVRMEMDSQRSATLDLRVKPQEP